MGFHDGAKSKVFNVARIRLNVLQLYSSDVLLSAHFQFLAKIINDTSLPSRQRWSSSVSCLDYRRNLRVYIDNCEASSQYRVLIIKVLSLSGGWQGSTGHRVTIILWYAAVVVCHNGRSSLQKWLFSFSFSASPSSVLDLLSICVLFHGVVIISFAFVMRRLCVCVYYCYLQTRRE